MIVINEHSLTEYSQDRVFLERALTLALYGVADAGHSPDFPTPDSLRVACLHADFTVSELDTPGGLHSQIPVPKNDKLFDGWTVDIGDLPGGRDFITTWKESWSRSQKEKTHG